MNEMIEVDAVDLLDVVGAFAVLSTIAANIWDFPEAAVEAAAARLLNQIPADVRSEYSDRLVSLACSIVGDAS